MYKYKIGIVTIASNKNYGNRLQNYALKKVLEDLGCEVDSIIIKTEIPNEFFLHKNFLKKIRKAINLTPKEWFAYLLHKFDMLFIQTHPLEVSRRNKIIDFTKDYLAEKIFYLNKDIKELDSYDFFIAGSDQIWHTNCLKYADVFFLKFCTYEKAIAYAPSFGISKISNELKYIYKENLNCIKHLSVREEEGAIIIKELLGERVPVLYDPTLLIDEKRWTTFCKPSKNKLKDKYLLTFFIGGISEQNIKKIQQVAKNNALKIVNLLSKKQKEHYDIGPREFLDYILNAELVFTDSFHATIFSIIFKVPFTVFERISKYPTMNSRMITLLSPFRLFERMADNNWEENVNFDTEDLKAANVIISKEKGKSIAFLKNSIYTRS